MSLRKNCIPRIQFVSFSSNTSPIAYAHVSVFIERTQKMGHVKLFVGSCHLCAATRVLFNCRLYQEKGKKIPRHSSSTIFFFDSVHFSNSSSCERSSSSLKATNLVNGLTSQRK
ncbi:hypothetical protein OUZ56_015875 [Daphnia magna]|uniref:Uncharacterized protein n=1 Tax=Daphnia magna TaxID=35525 RepID=A0ABR0AP04_9CRUS|nr:hypothetical protein OUZ56_015875 [Daphnia magna]